MSRFACGFAASALLQCTFGSTFGCAARTRLGDPVEEGRRAISALVTAAHATHPDRMVAHLSHTCSLEIAGSAYPIVDLQELVPGAQTPRGVNSILVFSPTGALVRRIEYTTQRPLFCRDNRLYVWGDITIEIAVSEGNELTFNSPGGPPALRHVEVNDLPAPWGGFPR